MLESPKEPAPGEADPLDVGPGSGEEFSQRVVVRDVESCCDDRYHRKLAIGSIICGCTCIGIVALIASVKAKGETDPVKAERFSRRAKNYGILAIVAWYGFVCLGLILMALCSYVISLRE